VKFQLTIEVDQPERMARRIIREMLVDAKLQLGDGRASAGALVYGAGGRQRPIGSWRLFTDETNDGAEAA
jgi:hypothetical protein